MLGDSMSKTVVTATTAARAKSLSRSHKLRNEDNQKHANEVVVPHQAIDDAQALHVKDSHTADNTLAGDFSFSGVMADAAASASLMDATAGAFGGMSNLMQDDASSSGGGMFGGDNTPLIIGGVVLVGAGIAVAASGGDDDNDTPVVPANAAPVFTAATLAAAVAEDNAAFAGKIVATDADAGATLTYATSKTLDGFVLKSDGSYTLDTTKATYQSLAEGETKTFTIDVNVTDGKVAAPVGGTLTFTVTGKNDAPTFAAAKQDLTIAENAVLAGTATATDIDNGSTVSYSVSTDGKNGHAVIAADGKFTYTPAADALEVNRTDSFVITASDGKGGTSTQTVNVGITNVGPTTSTIAVAAAGSNTDSDTNDTTYNVSLGNYNYTITGFDAGVGAGGDHIVGPVGLGLPAIDNSNTADGKVILTYASGGQVATITIDGLTTAQDAAIFGPNSFNTVFGAGSIA